MTTTRKQFTTCIIIIITGLLCTSHSRGQVDPGSVVGLWRFDEASGNIARDSSGHGYDADLKENPAEVEQQIRNEEPNPFVSKMLLSLCRPGPRCFMGVYLIILMILIYLKNQSDNTTAFPRFHLNRLANI